MMSDNHSQENRKPNPRFEIDLAAHPSPPTSGIFYGQAGRLMYVPEIGKLVRVLAHWGPPLTGPEGSEHHV
ncbi:hypothetical protein [Rhodococcus sp. SORGH_AS_0303]|uniref:hypothetical protein n=1 Tax=Rhodococcus sp. SORGH_AS_0303 TaxID=3041753 RepID=UPI002787639E|nr:hypothetical protein [Rhodococcus sp. SORGH_AS_0303]MDQ1202722.1 hypothetical protein [Rhodococcus sp. SORGH_AS_0303]